eukprot:COSAG02_NODE_10201_length_1996_cov_1.579336_4_plen_35_part_01
MRERASHPIEGRPEQEARPSQHLRGRLAIHYGPQA